MGEGGSFTPTKPYLDTDDFTFVFADVRGYGKSVKDSDAAAWITGTVLPIDGGVMAGR